MKLSIVITTRNREQDLYKCVESIKLSDSLPKKWELIIIDDNSSDDTKKINRNRLGLNNCQIIHNQKQLMMVKSRNLGVKKSIGKYILFIDDDNLIDKKMICSLIAFADSHKRFGILGPSMYYANKDKYLDYQKINLFTGKTIGYIDQTNKKVCPSDGIPNVFLIRREVFEKCGLFDEELVQTYTEPDFALKIRQFGYRCAILKTAITFHQTSKVDDLRSRSLGGKFEQKAYCLIRNRSVLEARYGSLFQKIVYILCFSWLWPLVYSTLVLREKKFRLIKLYWLGFFDGLAYILTGKLKWSFGR